MLKVLTANVQSLSLKIDELIALIQVENFDVIALNETWLDTKKQASACRSSHTWLHGLSHENQLQKEGEVDQSCMSKTP